MMQDDFGKVSRPFRELVPKLVLPSEEEIEKNSRSASVKMRVAERILKDDE
jgi:16S rRNA (cytosine1402-N4)-methyltransferase